MHAEEVRAVDWDEGVDFFEEDEPLDVIRAICSREPNVVTARPQQARQGGSRGIG